MLKSNQEETQAAESNQPKYLTAKELAKIYRCTPQAITNWAKSGRIPAYRIGHRWLFSLQEIEASMERNVQQRIELLRAELERSTPLERLGLRNDTRVRGRS